MRTPTTPIIGFSGYLRSGKDTAAQALIDDGWDHQSFAAKLKAFLHAVNPIVMKDRVPYRLAELVNAYGWEVCKDHYPEIRALLQRVGTEAGRNILGQNVWVDAVMAGLPTDIPEYAVVFTDVRFPNEADAIRAAGGLVVRVERRGTTPGTDAHPSETALDGYDFDHRLDNNGDIGRLHEQVRLIAQLHFAG